ncbi:MAG: MurT ligase domain-containing protein [Anaerovoracaceae bacterium]
MNPRATIAVSACKLSRALIRKLGGGATDFPGRVANKLYPQVLSYLAKDVTTILVTGTNGKTTTARMLEQMLKEQGLPYFCNRSGANLLNGITAEFCANADLGGRPRHACAIIECDEAAFKQVGRFLDPQVVLVTNVFRDQLDRYGEITHTLDNIRIGLQNSPHAVVCLNADCSLTASLREDINNPIVLYGVNGPIYKERVHEASDAPYCIHCKHEYTYDYITFGHLGKYHCDHCGYARPEPEVAVSRVLVSDAEHSEIEITADGTTRHADIALPGGYNIYNAVAAAAVAHAMRLDEDEAVRSLSTFECGFGRMEKFMLEETETRMILIKNPAGCNQVLNFLTNISRDSLFVICLNDNYADGTDISWIWDVDFEILQRIEDKLTGILISGVRADDMAMRVKYAGFPTEKLRVIKDYDRLIDAITAQPAPVYIMPTYTAMMDLRAIVSKRFGYKNFWE